MIKLKRVLIAEDDEDDRLLLRKAFSQRFEENVLHCVEDGVELMKYLRKDAPYDDENKYPSPQLVLLDLNMPKKDGRQVLKEIKTDKTLCKIPVIVLTTSHQQDDIESAYRLGTNSYITKPSSFEGLMNIARELENYWFKTVELPA